MEIKYIYLSKEGMNQMKMLADFDKEGFKKEVITNVKTLFRKPIEEATPRSTRRRTSRQFTICLWSS